MTNIHVILKNGTQFTVEVPTDTPRMDDEADPVWVDFCDATRSDKLYVFFCVRKEDLSAFSFYPVK